MTKKSYIKKEIIWGQEVDVEVIPEGVSGLKNKVLSDFYIEQNDYDEESPIDYDEKDYINYIEEGIDPDLDEVRDFKDEIERGHAGLLFDSLED